MGTPPPQSLPQQQQPSTWQRLTSEPLNLTSLSLACGVARSAAYVMVALHSAATGAVVKGFEKEGCVFMGEDDTWLPLRWRGESGASAMGGQPVFLRIHYRDATVFAVGAEEKETQAV